MMQVLLITLIIVFANRWWDARFPAAPAKPKAPKLPEPLKPQGPAPYTRKSMLLAAVVLTLIALFLALFPITIPYLLVGVPCLAALAIPAYAIKAKRQHLIAPAPTDSMGSPASVEASMLVPE